MAAKKKKKTVDTAKAKLPETVTTFADMIAAGNKHITAIQNDQSLASMPEVKTTVDLWEGANKKLATADKAVVDADVAASQARIDRDAVAHEWRGRAEGCINAVTVAAGGSANVITGLSLAIVARNPSPYETTPAGLEELRTYTTGVVAWKWTTHKNNHGYMVQHATNPADTATYSAPIHCTKGKFRLDGQTPEATLHLRVASLDSRLPGGQTPYSAWVVATVER